MAKGRIRQIAIRVATNKYLWALLAGTLIFFYLIKPAYFNETDEFDNRPPTVTRVDQIERTRLDHFRVSWLPSQDDRTPPRQIVYEMGVVPTGVCVVDEASFSALGSTEVEAALPDHIAPSPLVGFAVRSLDAEGDSYGYGPCRWAMRGPVRTVIDFTGRAPRLNSQDLQTYGSCRSDGQGSVWCGNSTQLAHLENTHWSIFPLPPRTAWIDWVPLDELNAVVRAETFQLHLNRAVGDHAFILSPENDSFTGLGGAIRTGQELGYLVVRGFVAEFSAGHIDLAGPPAALRLPDRCARILQLGREEGLVFALCRSTDSPLLFVGHSDGRLLSWQDPFEITGDRVEGIVGTESAGMAALSSETGANLLRWHEGQAIQTAIREVTGENRPILTLGGTLDSPVFLAGRADRMWSFQQDHWQILEGTEHHFVWNDLQVPRLSQFVGTSRGVYAISPDRTVLLGAHRAELLIEHGDRLIATRGWDARHYFVQQAHGRSVFSSRDGREWYEHPWEGNLSVVTSLAVTNSGGIYLSGWSPQTDPGLPPRPLVVKLGQEDTDSTLSSSAGAGSNQPPLLATDDLGRLYALTDEGVFWRHADLPEWSDPLTVQGQTTSLLGLRQGFLLLGHREGQPAFWRCRENDCVLLPTPDTVTATVTAAFAYGEGFCVTFESGGLWCRDIEDRWIAVTFDTRTASQYGVTPDDRWTIVDALPLSATRWLLAIRTAQDGFLAQVDEGQTARLIALGLHWPDGEALVHGEDGTIWGLETEGPFKIRLQEERFSVPGMLY